LGRAARAAEAPGEWLLLPPLLLLLQLPLQLLPALALHVLRGWQGSTRHRRRGAW